jgi:membrane-associated protease RseP (regulator of RpoE activity)
MKRFSIAALLALAVILAVSGVLVARAVNGAGSSHTAVAASQTQGGDSSSADSAPGLATQKVWLGAQIVRTPDGPTISGVIAGSPADKAGLQRGDVIKAVDGTSISDVAGLRGALNNKNPGDTVKLSITRSGTAQDITVTLEAPPQPLPGLPSFATALPELSGIPADQLFSHLLGGSFQFKDKDGNTHTASADLGTVTAVDTNAKTISVDLNAGGSKTYSITGDVVVLPSDLTKFQKGDHVVGVSIDSNLRAVLKAQGRLLPFFGAGKRAGPFHSGFGMGMTGQNRGGGGFQAQ